ncbi:MAG: hypothetical protein CME62_06770 [Halobacteriovoraceae bacterium]|nr:hypothetical protein [Halobacteriovoraceae bacterium]|tara:strand:- start:3532 stop:3972 length:441 start_codon:yes stop_codon:yes gene_type:complete
MNSAVKLLLLDFAKSVFIDEEKESIKDALAMRIMQDSKTLVIMFLLINTAFVMTIFAFACLGYYLIEMNNIPMPDSIFYLGIGLVSIALLLFIGSFLFLSKRFKMYRQMKNIKDNVEKGKSFLDPIKDQLRLEHQQMKQDFMVFPQ